MQSKIRFPKDIYTHYYYYAQVFLKTESDKLDTRYFVIFAETLEEAKKKSKIYLEENTVKRTIINSEHFYRNNYKVDAKKLIKANKYID